MILKRIQRSIHLLSFPRHSFGVLLLDDKDCQTDYDVLISDIKKDDLSGVISRILGKVNLSPLSSNEKEFQNIRNGIIYGYNKRALISLPTRFQNRQPVWIHYLIDSASPLTFLSAESIKFLTNLKKVQRNQAFEMKINGLDMEVGISKPHFQDINLLGMNYLFNLTNIKIIKGKEKIVQFKFDNKS